MTEIKMPRPVKGPNSVPELERVEQKKFKGRMCFLKDPHLVTYEEVCPSCGSLVTRPGILVNTISDEGKGTTILPI